MRKDTTNKLLEELAEPLKKAYNEMASYSGLSSDEKQAFKERILNTARERVRKGGLFFTETFTPEYAATVEGMERISLYLDMKMNEEEISILHDLSSKGISVVSKDVKEGLSISKEGRLIKRMERGEAFKVLSIKIETLKSPEQAFPYFLAAGKYYNTFDVTAIKKKVLDNQEEASEEKRYSFIEIMDYITLGGIMASIRNYERYELLRSRDYEKTIKTDTEPFFAFSYWGKGFLNLPTLKSLLLVWACETKAKEVKAEKLSQILNLPLDELKEIWDLIFGTPKRMSSELTRNLNQMLVNRDEKQTFKELREKGKVLERGSSSFKKALEKIPSKNEAEASKFLLEAINKHDLVSLSPLAQTVLKVILEDIGLHAGTTFTGQFKIESFAALAKMCGVEKPDKRFTQRLRNALEELYNYDIEYTRKGSGKSWELEKFRVLERMKTAYHGNPSQEDASKIRSFTITFAPSFMEFINNPKKFFISPGTISKVQAFYVEGNSNLFRPDKDKRKTTKSEIPDYTLKLIYIVEGMRSYENGNNSIGKSLLLRRMGLSKYLDRRRPKEAEWRLNEALAAVKEGGYYKTVSTHEGTSDGKQDIIFYFTLK